MNVKFDNPKLWYTHNKMLLNVTLFGYHLHVWMWRVKRVKASPQRAFWFRPWRICNIVFWYDL